MPKRTLLPAVAYFLRQKLAAGFFTGEGRVAAIHPAAASAAAAAATPGDQDGRG